MDLNQSTLRGILAQITSVDQKFIVPKQGNWWNPQEQLIKPDTWCAYQIRSNKPRVVPFYTPGTKNNTRVNRATVEKIATIDLQFVGPQSEDIAQSVALWPLRSDVAAAFKTVNGAVMLNDMQAISSIYYQDGNNSVMAWNVTIEVLWYQVVETSQTGMPSVQLNGKINN